MPKGLSDPDYPIIRSANSSSFTNGQSLNTNLILWLTNNLSISTLKTHMQDVMVSATGALGASRHDSFQSGTGWFRAEVKVTRRHFYPASGK